MDKLLLGKNAVITGAGRNIGKNIAIEMARQRANIFFTDIDYKRCTRLENELSDYPVVSRGFVSDVSRAEDIEHLVNSLVRDKIRVDILVNNVGIQFNTATIKDLKLEELYKVFGTNVFGPVYLTKLISQTMIDNHVNGSIIFITSIHQWTIRRRPSYSASKASLGMIIKEFALDLAPYKIRVNGIAPGLVKEEGDGKPITTKYTPLYNSSIDPSYIGRAAVYLASDYFSRFTTGSVIKIDAGLSLYNHQVDRFDPK